MAQEWLQLLAPYRNHTLILGCSGGVDSMVLLHFLHTNNFKLHLVHVNYHQRGPESDMDQMTVEQKARSMGIPLNTFHYSEAEAISANFQEAARLFRYLRFEEIQKIYENSKIVLAHHADDQVETFFMNLSRKSGVMGLAGMPFERGDFIRPMIWTFKNDIYEYAKRNKIQWREDDSNANDKYYRNRWRNEFIPLLEKEIPKLKQSSIELMKLFQIQQYELEASTKKVMQTIANHHELPLQTFIDLSVDERFELWRQLKQPSGTFEQFEELFSLEKGKKVNMTGDFEFVSKEDHSLYFSLADKILPVLPELLLEKVSHLPSEFSKAEIYLDNNLIANTLNIRRWQEGDRIASLGIKGTQLVSNIIKDSKIPNHQKNNVFVVEDAQEIHWVVGLKIGRNAIAQKESKVILKVGIRTFEGQKP